MSELSKLDPGSLAEHLYNHRRLDDLERLLKQGRLESLMRQWKLSNEECRKQIAVAIQYIEQD